MGNRGQKNVFKPILRRFLIASNDKNMATFSYSSIITSHKQCQGLDLSYGDAKQPFYCHLRSGGAKDNGAKATTSMRIERSVSKFVIRKEPSP